MKILVFGGGAVGLGLASCLIESGHCPDIIARGNTAERLNTSGLTRTGILGTKNYRTFTAFSDISIIKNAEPYDFILVCTKSNDSLSAAKIISEHSSIFNNDTCIVLCQNGWGNREIFTRFFPSKQVYSARVITGFCRPEPNIAEITVHVQPVRLGSLGNGDIAPLAPLRDAIHHGGLSCELTDTIGKDLWAKMLFNCSLNPLGAIFNVPYGELKKSDHTLVIIRDIINELFAVIKAAGYSTYWDTPDTYFEFLKETLIPGAASHESSTLQDIRLNKKTEIDALTGQVVALGDTHGVPVPVNRMVYRMIRFMERGSG